MSNNNPSFVLTEPGHDSPGKVVIENRPVPTISNLNDVIVEIKNTGICGSDVHYWTHGRIGQFIVDRPIVLGHESSGLVHSVGSSVQHLKAGDAVAIEPGIPCRVCPLCKSGSYNVCPSVLFAATPPFDGTLCRYYRVPADFCHKLPEGVSLEEGALVEPLSVAVHIAKQGDVQAGMRVVVFGAGPVGLLCMAVCRAFGVEKVVAVDVNEERLRVAKSFAADSTFLPRKDEAPSQAAERLVQETGLGGTNPGADVVLEATGAQVCAQVGMHVLKIGGVYVQGGMGKPDLDGLPIMVMMAKEVIFKTSFRYKEGDYGLAVSLIANKKVDVKALITSKVPFEKAEEAFGETRASKGIKTLIMGPES